MAQKSMSENPMSEKFTEGAPVRLADRETNAADTKSGLFYPHYRGLTGTLAKLYADETAAVIIDLDSLPDEIRKRHQTGTEAARQKWLDGLSDEARNKLSAAEKKFALRYSLLVSLADLTPGPAALTPISVALTESEPARKSLDELTAAEEQHLAEVTKKKVT